jgi:GalNAc-alpha-(1->4)-GalNAc-alpha-(1->3)-diNAcBac-PP-undecaprenol alpha-1,4-N-acetyl-D-galactosaminyltransferase
MHRITLVVASLACGGVERAVASLAAGLLQRGYHVSVLTFSGRELDFFSLSPGIRRSTLGLTPSGPLSLLRLPSALCQRLRALKNALDSTKPDLVIAYTPKINVLTLLATSGETYPVIVTEHGDVSVRATATKPWRWRYWGWYRLRRLCYRRATAVVSVSKAVDRNMAWLAPERRHIIHNGFAPVDLSTSTPPAPAGASWDRPWLVTMGRMVPEKAQEVLIDAFASIAPQFRSWQLILIGDGALRGELERRAAPLGDQIVFAGAVTDPYRLLQQAELFVMSSRYEGFPMALGEALMCGLPVIATDCPSSPSGGNAREGGGIRELVRDGVNGLLVPPEDSNALAEALATCMSDPHLRSRLSRNSGESVAHFSLPRILDKWEELFRKVGEKAPTGALGQRGA